MGLRVHGCQSPSHHHDEMQQHSRHARRLHRHHAKLSLYPRPNEQPAWHMTSLCSPVRAPSHGPVDAPFSSKGLSFDEQRTHRSRHCVMLEVLETSRTHWCRWAPVQGVSGTGEHLVTGYEMRQTDWHCSALVHETSQTDWRCWMMVYELSRTDWCRWEMQAVYD